MNVLIVGVCDVPHSTNKFMYDALVKLLGENNVTQYNYRTVLSEKLNDRVAMNKDLIEFYKASAGYSLIIFCKTDTLLPETLNYLSSETTTFYWYMDPIDTAFGHRADLLARECDFASAQSQETLDFFMNNGVKDGHLILEGVDMEMFEEHPDEEKSIDVLFWGSAAPERVLVLRELKKAGINLAVYGSGWPPDLSHNYPLYNENLAKTIGMSKIVLNISRSNAFSDRVLTAMACGGFVISTEIPEIRKWFKNKEDLVLYCNTEHLVRLVNRYLDPANKEEYERIRKTGQNAVRNAFSWEMQMTKLLGVVNIGKNTRDSE